MKRKFITKTLLFALPLMLIACIDIVFPITYFHYRLWDSLKFFRNEKSNISKFYPNMKVFQYSEGDLCFRTNNAVKKHELCITDKLGFRNEKFIQNPSVIIIGQSFIIGTGLNQNETIGS